MKIGCHVSIAGGIGKSVLRAEKLGINTMQIFSKNSLTWKEKIYFKKEIEEFQQELIRTKINPVFIHSSYLINLASPDKTTYLKSVNAFLEEIKRADNLLADIYRPYLVIHPGAHCYSGEQKGIENIINALNVVLEKCIALKSKTMILLENTSGSGTNLGYNFKQLRDIIENIENKQNIGMCLDTCHAFAAGYDISTYSGIKNMVKEIDKFVGLEKIKVIHLNDSKNSLGSRKDRHMHIGEGYIGKQGFRYLVNYPSLSNIPFILETPRENDKDDKRNIEFILRIRKEAEQ